MITSKASTHIYYYVCVYLGFQFRKRKTVTVAIYIYIYIYIYIIVNCWFADTSKLVINMPNICSYIFLY